MDQFNIWKLIGRQWKLILPLLIIVAIASLATYHAKPKGIAASVSVTVVAKPVNSAAASQLVIENNANQDTQLAVATTSTWFSDPGYVQQVAKAGIPLADSSVAGLSKFFTVVSPVTGSATYDVDYVVDDTAQANEVADAVRAILQSGSDIYNNQTASPLMIEAVAGSAVTSVDTSSLPLTPIAGLVVGTIFALVVAALVDRKAA